MKDRSPAPLGPQWLPGPPLRMGQRAHVDWLGNTLNASAGGEAAGGEALTSTNASSVMPLPIALPVSCGPLQPLRFGAGAGPALKLCQLESLPQKSGFAGTRLRPRPGPHSQSSQPRGETQTSVSLQLGDTGGKEPRTVG